MFCDFSCLGIDFPSRIDVKNQLQQLEGPTQPNDQSGLVPRATNSVRVVESLGVRVSCPHVRVSFNRRKNMHRLHARLHALVVILLALGPAQAREEPRVIQAIRVANDVMEVDGRADESAWKFAAVAGRFTQRDPEEGAAPTEPTFVRVAVDDRAVYVFIEARDSSPREILRFLTQRDIETPSDWLEVWLNPQNDKQTGYRFAVSARGVQLDSRFSQGGAEEEVNWHAVWTSAVTHSEEGWSAEIRIPFSELRFDRSSSTWDMQVVRRLARENETSTLSPLPKAAARPLLHMAELRGLSDLLPPASNLQIRPYTLVGWDKNARTSDFFGRAGGDARLQLTSSATLHVTAMPDFGQVQQDPSQLNLSALEIFQQERRQFFLDGRENLELRLSYDDTFNDHLYYSRRIGQMSAVEVDDGAEVHYPGVTNILGAGKVLGRTPSGLNFSMLSAVTDAESATVDLRGAVTQVPVASRTSYNVARVRQELQGGRGYIGAVGTYTHRFLHPLLESELTKRAVVGGGEFDFRFGDYGIMGQVLGSHITGQPEAVDRIQRSSTNNRQRSDAMHVDYNPTRTSLDGYAIALAGGKFDGSPWRAYWGGHARSSGFNTNDLGFLRTADYVQYNIDVQHRFDEPTWLTRFASLGGGVWLDKTMGAEITGLGVEVESEMQLSDNSWAVLGIYGFAPALDTNLLRGGPAILRPEGMGAWGSYSTDKRRNWDVETAASGEVLAERSYREGSVEVTANLRPVSSVELSFAPSLRSFVDDLQYVDTSLEENSLEYIIGRVDAQEYSLTLRVNWSLALGLTLRAYAQPFVTLGRFSQFYLVQSPRAEEYNDRRRPTAYDAPKTFFESALRSTVVLRWDFSPGSSAYAVWTREQSHASSEERRIVLARDTMNLARAPSRDTVLVKVEWFLGQ